MIVVEVAMSRKTERRFVILTSTLLAADFNEPDERNTNFAQRSSKRSEARK